MPEPPAAAAGEASASPDFVGVAAANTLTQVSTVPRVPPKAVQSSTLLTENPHDHHKNCLHHVVHALMGIDSEGQARTQVVFLRDRYDGIGHVVLRQGGRIIDPVPPRREFTVVEFNEHTGGRYAIRPGQLDEAGSVRGDHVLKVLNSGDRALTAERLGIDSSLQNMSVADDTRFQGRFFVSIGVILGNVRNSVFVEASTRGEVQHGDFLAVGQARMRVIWNQSQWGQSGPSFTGLSLVPGASLGVGSEKYAGLSWSTDYYWSRSINELSGTAAAGDDRLSQTNQRLGEWGLRLGTRSGDHFRWSMYNDSTYMLGDRGDSFRTAGSAISWSFVADEGVSGQSSDRITLGARLDLVTSQTDHKHRTIEPVGGGMNPYGQIGKYGISDIRGLAYEALSRGQLTLFGNYADGGRRAEAPLMVEVEMGVNAEWIRHLFQNLFVHDQLTNDPWVPVDFSKPDEPVFQLKLRYSPASVTMDD